MRASLGRKTGGRLHDPAQAGDHFKRPEDLGFGAVRTYHEVAVETGFLAQIVGSNLMAGGARHPVEREHRAFVALLSGLEVLEHFSKVAVRPGKRARHGHMAGRAGIFDFCLGARMVRHLAAHGCLPVGVARRMRHHGPAPDMPDGHVFPIRVGKIAVAGYTLIRSGERAVIHRLRVHRLSIYRLSIHRLRIYRCTREPVEKAKRPQCEARQ